MRQSICAAGLLAALALSAAPSAATADAVADFYKGRTVRISVGASAGGGYDLVARIIAMRLGAHIPGNPSIVVENIPSASGLVMANNLYNKAPRDGTYIGLPTNAIALEPRLKVLTRAGGEASFDVSKFTWLGVASRQPQILFFWHTAGIKTVEDLKTKSSIVAALATGSDSFILPTVINNMLGTKMKVVPGYEGHGDVFPALERDEVQGYNNSLAGTISSNPEYIKNGTLNVVIQFGRNRAAQIPDVPTAIEIAPNEADKNTLSFYAAKYELAYALIAPPGVPEDRVKALEAAFDATMKDPQYLSAAEKIRLSVDPLNAAQVAKIIDSIEKAPQAVIDRMREMMTPRPAN